MATVPRLTLCVTSLSSQGEKPPPIPAGKSSVGSPTKVVAAAPGSPGRPDGSSGGSPNERGVRFSPSVGTSGSELSGARQLRQKRLRRQGSLALEQLRLQVSSQATQLILSSEVCVISD